MSDPLPPISFLPPRRRPWREALVRFLPLILLAVGAAIYLLAWRL